MIQIVLHQEVGLRNFRIKAPPFIPKYDFRHILILQMPLNMVFE
jgi:hypothetical protein